MHSRFSHLAIASLAALAFSGCEWGGVHDHTWNDGYSWADFTGTYRFVNAVIIPASDTAETGSDTSTVGNVVNHGTGNGSMSSSYSGSGKVSPVGLGIVPGTFSMLVGSAQVSDLHADGTLYYGSNPAGSVSYAGGGWSINTAIPGATSGTHISITYDYETAGPGNPTSGVDTTPISYLNVVQQGNTFTMTGDSGIKYTGRMTGSNVSKDGYVSAQTVNISFEVSSANGQSIVGSFSGVWSGATDQNYGTLSNRKINGTHSRAGNFVGVAADKSIYVRDAYTTETGPTTFAEPSNQ